jgi:hypothetical protein
MMHKGKLEEKRAHFLRREKREGEEAQIPRDIERREKDNQQYWVDTHSMEGIGKHPRGDSTFFPYNT